MNSLSLFQIQILKNYLLILVWQPFCGGGFYFFPSDFMLQPCQLPASPWDLDGFPHDQDGSPQDEFPVKMSSSAHCSNFSSADLLVQAFLFFHPQVIPCLDSECSCSFIYLISSLSSYYFYGLDTEMGNFHVSGSPGNIVHHLESATLHQLTCTHSM